MKLSRRNYMSLTAAALVGHLAVKPALAEEPVKPSYDERASSEALLPDRRNFNLGKTVYLNAASQHPMPQSSRDAVEAYLTHKQTFDKTSGYELNTKAPIEKFARLVGADVDDISYVQSTTAGEQMVIRGLGLPHSGAKIVTDTLHFFGSLPLYADLEKRGCEVTWVKPQNNRILLEDMEKAITPGTKLVSLSLVSTINGFQHDLKAICDLAHARGALVYADIIHAAGCVPVNLKDSGVDFAACASYKWLMGDFGLGFLYASKSALSHLRRENWGYYGISEFTSHVYPLDPPGETIVDYKFADTATGAFALGTYNHVGAAQLNTSLDYILDLGVETINAHAQPLIQRVNQGMKDAGFDVITPESCTSPFVAAAYPSAYDKLSERFKTAGIQTTFSRNRIRPSVSVFNSMDDVEYFLEILGVANND